MGQAEQEPLTLHVVLTSSVNGSYTKTHHRLDATKQADNLGHVRTEDIEGSKLISRKAPHIFDVSAAFLARCLSLPLVRIQCMP